MDEQVHVIAVLKVQNERVEEATELLRSLATPSRKEAGCIEYRFVQDVSDQSVILSTETWLNLEAFQQHLVSHHFVSTFEQLKPLLDSEPIIHVCNPLV